MTSHLIEKSKTHFFSSSPLLGAKQRSVDGSKFEVRLDTPIMVPPSAIDATIECVAANVWRTSPNISAVLGNNILYYNHFDGVLTSLLQPLVIPDGLYSIDGLDTTISRLLQATPNPSNPAIYFTGKEINFFGDKPTQRVFVELAPEFGLVGGPPSILTPNNLAQTLGFDVSPATGFGGTHGAQNIATLNKLNSYVIHTNLVHGGIAVNNIHDNILTEIQLTAAPGDLLAYRPYIPYVIDGTHLKSGPIDLIEFRLTNELGEAVDTAGEDWSFSVVVKYKVDSRHIMMNGYVPTIHGMSGGTLA